MRVWGVGTARTLRVHWMLHELGLAYETKPVQSRTGETQTDEYLALNPRGKIPVLEDGSLVLAESGAITAYLADRHAPGRFAPVLGSDARAVHDQWCYFILTELDATSLYVVRRHRDLPAVYGEAPAAVESSYAYFERQTSVAEAELASGGPYLLGADFQLADLYLTTCLDWASFYGRTLSARLVDYAGRVHARPAFAAAFAENFPPEVLSAMR